MTYNGMLLKMSSALVSKDQQASVHYSLSLEGQVIDINSLTGSHIRLEYRGKINCIHCGRETKKSFAQGYCYPCYISLPQTDACSLHPEKCRAHLGISRDMEWSKKNCLSPHIVYLALSPELKVGVTRESQLPVRWIDQGASSAIKLARTPDRHTAGLIEVYLKKFFSDKTNWRKMLTEASEEEGIDLVKEKERAASLLDEGMRKYISPDNHILNLDYPVISYPEKVKTVNFDKLNIVSGKLKGIKGQYLIFEGGNVFNIRRHSGYLVTLNLD